MIMDAYKYRSRLYQSALKGYRIATGQDFLEQLAYKDLQYISKGLLNDVMGATLSLDMAVTDSYLMGFNLGLDQRKAS